MNSELKNKAFETRILYRNGKISIEEAKKELKEYEKHFNEKSIELAKKYNQKPKKFSFNSFMR